MVHSICKVCFLQVVQFRLKIFLNHIIVSHGEKVEVILNRRIIEHNADEPTDYTIIYKYVRNKLGGILTYIEIDVANCVSIIVFIVHMN